MDWELEGVLRRATDNPREVRKYSDFIKQFAVYLDNTQVNYLINRLVCWDFPGLTQWILENIQFTILYEDLWEKYSFFRLPFSRWCKVMEILVSRSDFVFTMDIEVNLYYYGNTKWLDFFVKKGYPIKLRWGQIYKSEATVNYLTKRLKLDIPAQAADYTMRDALHRRMGYFRESIRTLWICAKRTLGKDVANLIVSHLKYTGREGCWER